MKSLLDLFTSTPDEHFDAIKIGMAPRLRRSVRGLGEVKARRSLPHLQA
jgi:hypothetical protein